MAIEGSIASRLCNLQECLKREKLFVNKEKVAISNLNAQILSSFERLYHLSWITRQQWKVVQRVRASPEECSQAVNRLDFTRFVDASTHLGYLESKYWEFLRVLRENPFLLASTLAFADQINFDTSLLIRLLLNSLYGNCLLPQDERLVLLLMKHLMEFKITGNGDPEILFNHHRNSFTALFGILVESLFSTKLYLTAALHAPIMQVLSEDSLFKKRLPRQCTKFVENLEAKLYCFPQSLHWLVNEFYNSLSSCGKFTEKKVRAMVLKLLFDFLVCPAIIRPGQFGITCDVQISEIALQNLQQIASCLLCSCSSEGEITRTTDMFSRIDQDCITSFLDAVLEGQKSTYDYLTNWSSPSLCRNSVLITENELHALISFFRMVNENEDCGHLVDRKELSTWLSKLPLPDAPNSTTCEEQILEIGTDAMGRRSSTECPKPSKQKRRPRRKTKLVTGERKTAEVETPVETKAFKQLNPFAVVNRSEEFKEDCVKRLLTMFQEDEEVLIVSLGYSSIECPGMLSEEKVLGIGKPKQEAEPQGTFRSRSSSSKFSKNINTIMTKEKKPTFDSEEENSDHKHTVSDEDSLETAKEQPPPPPSQSYGLLAEGNNVSKTAPATLEMDDVDLLNRGGGEMANRGVPKKSPDVLEGSRAGLGIPEHSGSVDLIDFGSETTQPVASITGEGTSDPNAAKLHQNPFDLPAASMGAACHLAFYNNNQDSGNRDSAISTASSTRNSLSSSTSTRSSGLGFHRDNLLADSANDDIPEETTHGEGFRKRTSLLVPDEKRRSFDSSISGGTLPGNRVSQTSFDAEFPPRSSSSSTAEEERDVVPSRSKKALSHSSSLKGKLKIGLGKDKTRKDSLEFENDNDNNEQDQKKDNGLFKLIKTTSTSKISKKSGTKVYERLAEKTIEAFDIAKVEEKTPRDIETIIEKYTSIAMNNSLDQPGSATRKDMEDSEEEEQEEEDDFLDERERFENAKRKLRLVLCQADNQNLPWLFPDDKVSGTGIEVKTKGQELMVFLHMQLAEAINLQDKALSAQLHETIRTVRELPPINYSNLLDTLEEEYKARAPYLAYLIKAHQGLLCTQAHLERLVERVERDKVICRNYFITTCVKLFLESKEKGEINKFCSEFQSLPIPDEKNNLLEDFLGKMAAEMETHPIWTGVSQEQLQDTAEATERAIMSIIYKLAFYPNGEIDMEIDRKFHEHVTNLQKVVHPNHKAVRVPKKYRKEAPWESAQNELSKINAYKTPTDKLKCIKRCCATIMNLLCLASETSVPGADEFVPALVYVVIHSNPPSLLSTVKYVTTFYDKRLTGEDAYYWMQFCAAIAFIKTLS